MVKDAVGIIESEFNMINIDENTIEINFDNVKSYIKYYDKFGEPLVEEYSQALDEKVADIKTYLDNVRKYNLDFDVPSLSRIVIDLSSTIYYTQDRLEKLNLLADMSKIKYKDSYNEAYTSRQTAAKQEDRKYTAEQLRAIAEQESLEENLISFIYNRAASILKGKIDAAYELLKAVSKSLSAAIAEMNTYQVSNKFHS